MEELGIKRITVHSEKAAAYMADGFARISHKPGIIMAQSVGVANIAAGIQDAYLAHSPVIAITGRKSTFSQKRNAYQEIIHNLMFDAVTKCNITVDSALELPLLLKQAFKEASTGAPRPVHLDLLGVSGDYIENEDIKEDIVVEYKYTKFPATRIVPEDKEIISVLSIINKAQKPVIIYGSGAASSDVGEEILKLSECLSIPVSFSRHGKGLIPDSYPLNAGSVGTYSC